MKKLLVSLVLLLGLGIVSEAAGPVKGAKPSVNVNYSTTVSSVSVSGPAVLYQVMLSTGTAGTDYTALFDSATSGAISAATITTNLKVRVNVSSATQNTVITFDPPIQFNNGIVAANSSASNWAVITYEKGRVTQGY